MESDHNKAVALAKIADSYSQDNKEQEALEFLEEALEIAKNSNSHSFKSSTLQSIARSYVNAGKKDIAQDILSQAQEEINNVGDITLQPLVINSLGYELITAGKYDEALQYIESNSKTIPINEEVEMLLQIATEYQKIGELDKTDAIINQAISKVTTIPKERGWIDPKLLQSFGLRDIAHKLLKYHQYDKALEIVDKIPLTEHQVSLLSDIPLWKD